MNASARRAGARVFVGLLAAAAAALILVSGASAASPQNTTPPSITGTAREGQTLTASNGSWSNTPTSFTYQWQRCASDGTGCGDITGATSQTYAVVAADVGHTVRVVVTAVNADGKTPATSAATDVVGSKNGPSNTVKPSVTGSAVVGDSLSVSNGSWSPSPTSFGRQWQVCSSDGTGCVNISGATGQTYGVRSSDVGHRLRALVTAHTATDQSTVASSLSGVATSNTVTTTQTTTTTVTTPAPTAPTVSILSLRLVGTHVYARFRVCAKSTGTVKITERDQKARALPYTRHLAVVVGSCNAFSRNWLLLSRFRSPGRLLVTMRASSHGQLSALAEHGLTIH